MDMRNYSHFRPQKPFSPVTCSKEIRFNNNLFEIDWFKWVSEREGENRRNRIRLFCIGMAWTEHNTDQYVCSFCRHFFVPVVLPLYSFGSHTYHTNSLHQSYGYFNWSILCVFIRNITISDLTLNWISKSNACVLFLAQIWVVFNSN